MKTTTYMVSDTLDNDLPVLVSNSLPEVAAFLGMTPRTASSAISKGSKVGRRYRVVRMKTVKSSRE